MPSPALPPSSATLLLIDQGDSELRSQVESECARSSYRLLAGGDTPGEALPQVALVRSSGNADNGILRKLRTEYPRIPIIFLIGQSSSVNGPPPHFSATVLTLPVRALQLRVAVQVALQAGPTSGQPVVRLRVTTQTGERTLDSRAIHFLQARHVYVQAVLSGGETVSWRSTLAVVEEQLPRGTFVRPHRSYLINLTCVDAWNAERIRIGTAEIPISRGRRREVVSRLRDCFHHFG